MKADKTFFLENYGFMPYNFKMVLWKKASFFALASFLFFSFVSCTTTKASGENAESVSSESPVNSGNASLQDSSAEPLAKDLTMIFAGDVMAHSENYKGGHFSEIWEDVSEFIKLSDYAFANIEAPVSDEKDWMSYPQFNMHTEYVEEAIKAGFNVFSLSNNHTNDQGLEGIRSTKKYFENLEKSTENLENGKKIHASGLKEKSEKLNYRIFEKNGWKILFCAVTELLNGPAFSNYINYFPSVEASRAFLTKEMKRLKEENGCNFSILSVHTDDTEYKKPVTESHRTFFRSLISDGKVNIVWANHPHLAKPFEFFENGFIMYANGNTISGQRRSLHYDSPDDERSWTGDGMMIKIKVSLSPEKNDLSPMKADSIQEQKALLPEITLEDTLFITTYIDPSFRFVIRKLDENFIKSFRLLNYKKSADFFSARLKLLKEQIWQ